MCASGLLPPGFSIQSDRRAADGVRKWLFRLRDGEAIETVLIPGRRRSTVCISSQSGCAVGCSFCATARMGARRDLAAEEITGQYLAAAALAAADGVGLEFPIRNLVFMGMGEPFLNFDAVSLSLESLITDHGFHSGIITVSTIGIPERILEFGARFPLVRLAVSLHSPFEEERSRIVPVNRRWPIAAVLAACREYQARYGRRIFFEYVLIRGVNDDAAHAEALAEKLRGIDATVNLIPLHPGGEAPHAAPERASSDAFRARLVESFPGHVTFRRSRGLDIEAACGQLAVMGR